MTSTAPTSKNASPPDEILAALDTLTFGAGKRQRPHAHGAPAFRTILACTDGSAPADVAVAWAEHLAKLHGSRVLVASVFAPPHLDPGIATGYPFFPGYTASFDGLEKSLREAADDATAKLRDAGVDAESLVAIGSVAEELKALADGHHADLVIVGSRHRGALQATLFGSTADALLDRVQASVLVAREPPPVKKILAATDGSHASYRAVAFSLGLASATGAELVVQHVLEYPEEAQDLPTGGLLRDVIARMELARPPHVSYQLAAGRPAEVIVESAREQQAGLVAVGSRGLGRLKGWLLGGVSRRVAARAPTNVLVVKDP